MLQQNAELLYGRASSQRNHNIIVKSILLLLLYTLRYLYVRPPSNEWTVKAIISFLTYS